MNLLRIAAFAAACLTALAAARADVLDPYDPFSTESSIDTSAEADQHKSAEELMLEASQLFSDERPLDARTKLLRVLQKNPKEYRAHMLLAAYYMETVGHFRLALKYIRQAQALFQEMWGKPPYFDYMAMSQHEDLLYLLSQARLNLDDYEGSLSVLDEYAAHKYFRDWYPGSRAWVLMKLGRIDEAIKVARTGLLLGAEPGRTLNMLGILLSMKGEREDSLGVFRQAVEYELSRGKSGRPATPLNNSGEVQEEIFNENLAESTWIKATRMPDGCEHVLPSLNLALLYIDQNNYKRARETIDAFEACVAQYPLRNGEEHRALVHFARGRIDLRAGRIDSALEHLEAAQQKQQWFGKIGTSQEDLRAGVLISLAQALRAKNNITALTPTDSFLSIFSRLRDRFMNSMRARWFMRRARQILSEDLANFEDLYIRNTDSMIEYPTLGELLRDFPRRSLSRRIEKLIAADNRPQAHLYYKAYLAENYLNNWRRSDGLKLLAEVIGAARERYDDALKTHALILKIGTLDASSAEYETTAAEIMGLQRAALRNYGYRLPVNFSPVAEREILDAIREGPFLVNNRRPLPFTVEARREEGAIVLRFASSLAAIGDITVRAGNLDEASRSLAEQVFTHD